MSVNENYIKAGVFNFHLYDIPRFVYYLGILFIAQTIWRPIYSLTMSDFLFLISFVMTVTIVFVRKKFEFRIPNYFILGLIVFSIGGIISSATSSMPKESLIAVAKYIFLIGIWFWLGTIVLRKDDHFYSVIFIWSLSSAITSAAAILQLIWGDIIPWAPTTIGRMTGFTEHVNDLGGATCVVLVPSLMLAIQDGIGSIRKSLMWVFSGLITAGLILSVSLSGVFAAVAALFAWGFTSRKPFKNIGLIILIGIVGTVTVSFSTLYGGSSLLERLYDVAYQGLSFETSATRIEAYGRAWESILHNPIIGVGPGPITGLTETGESVHNFVFLNWYESGIFGLIGVLIILIGLCVVGINLIKRSESNNKRAMSIALLSSYISFLVMGMAQPIYYKRFGWISAALIIALYADRRRSYELNNKHIILKGISNR